MRYGYGDTPLVFKKKKNIYKAALTSYTVSQQNSLKEEQHNLQDVHTVQRQIHIPQVRKIQSTYSQYVQPTAHRIHRYTVV